MTIKELIEDANLMTWKVFSVLVEKLEVLEVCVSSRNQVVPHNLVL